jgi:hypothetical protein
MPSEPAWYRGAVVFGLYVDPIFVRICGFCCFLVGPLEFVFESSGWFDVIIIARKVSVDDVISNAV